MSHYDFDSDRSTLIRVAGNDGQQVQELLDDAADAARDNNLRHAANSMEKIRQILVGKRLFQGWDDGIWVFTALIRYIRNMSKETVVPDEYQYLLDAIPSARMDESMTGSQKKFWYGSVSEPVGGQIYTVKGPDAAPMSNTAAVIWLVIIALAVAAYFFYN